MIATNGLDTLLANLEGVKSTGAEKWQACCPAHDDSTASLSIKVGDDGKLLLKCHANCATRDVVRHAGLEWSDLFPVNGHASKPKRQIVAVYPYHWSDGTLEYEAVRFEPKGFAQRRNAENWKMAGARPVPYRLPELIRSDPAATRFIAEGEKDCDRLRKLGLVATTNIGGAGSWKPEFAPHFLGAKVVVLADNDPAGRKHARDVAISLVGAAASVKIIDLPGLPEKGDVSDWLAAGGTVAELHRIADETPEFDPSLSTDSNNAGDLSESVDVDAPRTSPPKPFPVGTLPGPVAEFVTASAKAIGCDESFIGLPLLCCLARAVGNSRVIQVKHGWNEPAVLWGAIVAKSGSHKTPSMQQATKFLEAVQARKIAEHVAELEQYAIDKSVHDKNIAEWKRGKTNDPPPSEPQEPVCTRYLTADATIEALVGLLAKQFDGLLVCRDELAGWLNFDEYKNGRGSGLGHWLSMWSASSMNVDRKTGTTKLLHIRRAAVSLIGGIQPGVLKSAIGREHMQDGLCARLLLAMPEPKPVVWTDEIVDWAIESRMTRVFDALLTLEPGTDEDGDFHPTPVPMTTEAKQIWIEYFNRHRGESAGLDDDLVAAWTKLEAYTARLALVLQLCSWASGEADANAIDESTMVNAIELSDWFGGEAKRVYGLFGESDKDVEVRELAELVRRKGGVITPRGLVQQSRKYKNVTDAESALDSLRRAGLGRWVVSATATNQRREFQMSTGVYAYEFK